MRPKLTAELTVATAGADGRIHLWDVASGKPKETLHWHTAPVTGVAFSPDGLLLATCSNDGTVQVHEVNGGGRRHSFQPAGRPLNLAFSADGRTLAAVTALPQAALYLWDLGDGRERVNRGHIEDVISLAFDPLGPRLATGGRDGTLRLWSVGTDGTRVRVIGPGPFGKQLFQIAFAPGGHFLATANENGTITILHVPPAGV